ncbi:MAG: hypothetical protein WC002_00145 [Candidatus Muiribacteriota bacterium]|jgi:hypothetical protein
MKIKIFTILIFVIIIFFFVGLKIINQRYALFCEYLLQDEGFSEYISEIYTEPDNYFSDNKNMIFKIIISTIFSEEAFFIKINKTHRGSMLSDSKIK